MMYCACLVLLCSSSFAECGDLIAPDNIKSFFPSHTGGSNCLYLSIWEKCCRTGKCHRVWGLSFFPHCLDARYNSIIVHQTTGSLIDPCCESPKPPSVVRGWIVADFMLRMINPCSSQAPDKYLTGSHFSQLLGNFDLLIVRGEIL